MLKATSVVQVKSDRVLVTEWRFAPEAETGWHVHGHDYVVVPMMNGALLLEEPGDVSRTVPMTMHAPYARLAGVEHNVINASGHEYAFLEVEIVR